MLTDITNEDITLIESYLADLKDSDINYKKKYYMFLEVFARTLSQYEMDTRDYILNKSMRMISIYDYAKLLHYSFVVWLQDNNTITELMPFYRELYINLISRDKDFFNGLVESNTILTSILPDTKLTEDEMKAIDIKREVFKFVLLPLQYIHLNINENFALVIYYLIKLNEGNHHFERLLSSSPLNSNTDKVKVITSSNSTGTDGILTKEELINASMDIGNKQNG